MTNEPTLLSYITDRYIGNSSENLATDALGFILNRSEVARKALSDVLQANAEGISPIVSVKTQFVLDDRGIPDLACFDAGGQVRALLEAKIFAPPTDHQPNTYWKSLPHDVPSAAAGTDAKPCKGGIQPE